MCIRTLATDFNGPLVNMNEVTRKMLQAITGLNIPATEFIGKGIVDNDEIQFQPKGGGDRRSVTEAEWRWAKSGVYDQGDENFCRLAIPNEGLAEAIVALMSEGCAITVVSSCGGLTPVRFKKWARWYGIPITDVVTGERDKLIYYNSVDGAIDDTLQNLRSLDRTQVIPIFMADVPPPRLPEGIIYAPSWPSAVDLLLAA